MGGEKKDRVLRGTEGKKYKLNKTENSERRKEEASAFPDCRYFSGLHHSQGPPVCSLQKTHISL